MEGVFLEFASCVYRFVLRNLSSPEFFRVSVRLNRFVATSLNRKRLDSSGFS